MTEQSELRNRPLFICGHPKAGTSLVRAIFDSHPQLVVFPEETVFFRRFLPKATSLDLAGQLELAERMLIHIFRWNRDHPTADQKGYLDRDYSSISYAAVCHAMHSLADQELRHPGDILSAAVLAYGQVSGQTNPHTSRWVEKSPYNEYFAEQIFAWWPQARCIHILRDPRDNFASYSRKHPAWSAEFFAANWVRSTQTGFLNRQRFGQDRYFILRFEDLTRSPVQYLSQLSEFLEIQWDDSLAAPTRAGEQWRGNSMFANQFQEISAAPVARWKEKLAPIDAAVIELKAAALFKTFNYQIEALSAGGFTRQIAARWRWLSWPVRRRLQQRDRADLA